MWQRRLPVVATSQNGVYHYKQIVDDFNFLEDWEDRYRYIIDLGKKLPVFEESLKDSNTKVNGCASQVWIFYELKEDKGIKFLNFKGDSDALIVKGLIAVLMSLYNDVSVEDALTINALDEFVKLGLDEHLSSQRSNGLKAMMDRIKLILMNSYYQ